MERQVLADSAAWERRVPAPDAFNARLRRHLTEEYMREQEPAPLSSWLAETTSEQESVPLPSPKLRPPSRTRTLLAVAAAVVVVGLLAAVFASLTQGRTGQSPAASATATDTAAAGATSAPVHMLAARPALRTQPGVPVVAPSDPNVIYEYADNGPGVVLRRSDDGGATWRDLSYPTGGRSVDAIAVAVSPLDAHNVFLRLDLGNPTNNPSVCLQSAEVQHGGILASGGGNCRYEFYSRDGGQTWIQFHLPVAGSLFASGVTFTYDASVFQAQGSRLYGRIWYGGTDFTPATSVRIGVTTDGGKSWRMADGPLAITEPHICAFAATPQGSTLFALAAGDCLAQATTPYRLWRSDDAGAHWRDVGSFPRKLVQAGFSESLIAANLGGQSSQPVLYATGLPYSAGIYASNDGGTTWHAAPVAGLPRGAEADLAAGQPLSDGSLVVAFTGRTNAPAPATPTEPAAGSATATPTPPPTPTPFGGAGGGVGGTVAVYVWRADANSWSQLTPATTFTGPNVSNVFVSEGTTRAVTLSVADDLSTNPTYTVQRFQ